MIQVKEFDYNIEDKMNKQLKENDKNDSSNSGVKYIKSYNDRSIIR